MEILNLVKMAKTKRSKEFGVYLLNDDTNSFKDVILILEMMLGFNTFQAEQIATIIHGVGEYRVMKGKQADMEEFSEMLIKNGLSIQLREL